MIDWFTDDWFTDWFLEQVENLRSIKFSGLLCDVTPLAETGPDAFLQNTAQWVYIPFCSWYESTIRYLVIYANVPVALATVVRLGGSEIITQFAYNLSI